MSADPNDTVFIEAELELKSDKAIKVTWKTEEMWLPKSRIKYDDDAELGQMIEVELPIWLAREKGVI